MPEKTIQIAAVDSTPATATNSVQTAATTDSGNMVLYIILGVVALIVIFLVSLYNKLVQIKNKVDEGWSDIDVQLKRRYDLIPNLVETVKGYATHEKGTLEGVMAARSQAMTATSPEQKAESENMLSNTLKSLFAVTENYPDLKANQNFLDLQQTLKEIEEHIQMSRRYYNGTVREYNTQIQMFPNNLVSPMFGFGKREFFGLDNAPAERENVAVKF